MLDEKVPSGRVAGHFLFTTVAGAGGMHQEELASDRPKDGWRTGEKSQVLKPQNGLIIERLNTDKIYGS